MSKYTIHEKINFRSWYLVGINRAALPYNNTSYGIEYTMPFRSFNGVLKKSFTADF